MISIFPLLLKLYILTYLLTYLLSPCYASWHIGQGQVSSTLLCKGSPKMDTRREKKKRKTKHNMEVHHRKWNKGKRIHLGHNRNTDRQNITEILLKVALNTIKQKHNIKLCPHVDVSPNIVDDNKIKLLAFSICTCLWALRSTYRDKLYHTLLCWIHLASDRTHNISGDMHWLHR
jgi:hypothetical protein